MMEKCFSVTKRASVPHTYMRFLGVCILRFHKVALLGQGNASSLINHLLPLSHVFPLTVLCLLQVLSKGHLLGPTGVEVRLSRVGTEEKLQSVTTQAGGK